MLKSLPPVRGRAESATRKPLRPQRRIRFSCSVFHGIELQVQGPAREPPNLLDLSRGSQLSPNRGDCTASCARLPSARAWMICLIIEIFCPSKWRSSASLRRARDSFRSSSSAAVVWTLERSISPNANVIGPFWLRKASTAQKTRRCSFAESSF